MYFHDNVAKVLKSQISRKSIQCKPGCSMRTDRHTWRS